MTIIMRVSALYEQTTQKPTFPNLPMHQTSTHLRASKPTQNNQMQKSHTQSEGRIGPRATTLAILRQFARNYCPTPIVGMPSLGGVVIN